MSVYSVTLWVLRILLFSHSVMSDSLWPHGLQHVSLPVRSPSPRFCPSSCPLNWWCYSTILSSAALLSFAFNLSQHQSLFQWLSCLHQVARVFELQLQHQSFQWVYRVISLRIDWFDFLAVQGTLKESSLPRFRWRFSCILQHLQEGFLPTGNPVIPMSHLE